MKFRDFKTEAPKTDAPISGTNIKQTKKVDVGDMGIAKAAKDVKDKTVSNFKAGYDAVKQQQRTSNKGDGSVLGALGAIAGTGKQAVDLAKTTITPPTDIVDVGDDDKDATAKADPKAKAEPKAKEPEAYKKKKYIDTPIKNPKDLEGNNASFVDAKTNLLYQWNEKDSKWHPVITKQQKARSLDRDSGIKGFNASTGNSRTINEGLDARIQHIEDEVIFNGSAGAKRALAKIKSMASSKDDVQIKWDGSPAVIFGRDENGEFMLTDKGGFVAKGYDGKAKSGDALEKMFLNRPGAKKDPKGFTALGANMKNAFGIMEKATPKGFRGYFKGDMLYFHEPQQEQDMYHFKPNIVQYTVKTDSDIGKKINASKMGVVVHRVIDKDGNEQPFKDFDIMEGNELLVIPPVTVSETPSVDESNIGKLEALISSNGSAIDSFLDKAKLKQMQVSDFPNILYTYINQKVDSGLDNLGRDFLKWLGDSKVSGNKQRKIQEYVSQNVKTFSAIWDTVNGIMSVKNNIIDQLNNQDADVKATINGQPGGEGYVLADPDGDMKLVNRGKGGFTAANRSIQR
jgi:hypothetical protein